MNRLIIVLGALLALAPASLGAGEKTPTIVFDTQTKDFGAVQEGETLKHVFRFTNKGEATLEILKVESS